MKKKDIIMRVNNFVNSFNKNINYEKLKKLFCLNIYIKL